MYVCYTVRGAEHILQRYLRCKNIDADNNCFDNVWIVIIIRITDFFKNSIYTWAFQWITSIVEAFLVTKKK